MVVRTGQYHDLVLLQYHRAIFRYKAIKKGFAKHLRFLGIAEFKIAVICRIKWVVVAFMYLV